MNIFNKLFIAYYFRLVEKRDPDPRFGAVSYITVLQIFLVGMPFITYQVIFNTYTINSDQDLKYLVGIPLSLIWMFVVLRYYSKDKIKILKAEYNCMDTTAKIKWKKIPIIVQWSIIFYYGLFIIIDKMINQP